MTVAEILNEACLDNIASVITAVRRAGPLAATWPTTARIAFLRNLTLESIEPFIKYHCYRDAIRPEMYFAGYDTARQELLDPDSPLHGHAPDVVVVALQLEYLAPHCRQPGWRADTTREQLTELIESACERTAALVAVNTFLPPFHSEHGLGVPADRSDLSSQVEDLNQTLRDFAAARPGRVVLIDWQRLVRVLGEAGSMDYRYGYLARAPFKPAFLNLYAHELAKVVRALKGKTKKVLALDCDNTLWGGIVGEDGLGGIALNPHDYPGRAYYDFQAAVLHLVARGVLVVLCSKNNAEEVWEVLDRHPHCLLKREHVAAARIDWNDKVANLIALATELNVGLDSFVAVDDSAVECERMRRALPEVVVAAVPEQRYLLPAVLTRDGWFDTLTVSQEDRQRVQKIQHDAQRQQQRVQSEDLDSYLASLEMVARIHPARPIEIARVAQLTQKTNQFNLTTRRYSAAEIEKLATAPKSRVFTLTASDRFGDLGLVGVLIARRDGNVAAIDSLLLSCRALGRGLELAFVQRCLQELAVLWPVERIAAEYIATARNAQVADFWDRLGFERVDGDGDRYRIRPDQVAAHHTHVRILEDEG